MRKKEGSEETTLEQSNLTPSRGTPKGTRSTRSPAPQPQRSWCRPAPPHRPRPWRRRRAGSQNSGPETLPLSDIKGAGAKAFPVQHGLSIWLLLPEPLSRPRRRETFEKAHCNKEHGNTSQQQTKAQQTPLAASRPGSGNNYPGRAKSLPRKFQRHLP